MGILQNRFRSVILQVQLFISIYTYFKDNPYKNITIIKNYLCFIQYLPINHKI